MIEQKTEANDVRCGGDMLKVQRATDTRDSMQLPYLQLYVHNDPMAMHACARCVWAAQGGYLQLNTRYFESINTYPLPAHRHCHTAYPSICQMYSSNTMMVKPSR